MAVVIPPHVKKYILAGLAVVSAFVGMAGAATDYEQPAWQRVLAGVPFMLAMWAVVWILIQPESHVVTVTREEKPWRRHP